MKFKMGEILKDFTVFTEQLETFILSYGKKTSVAKSGLNSTILRPCNKPNICDFSVAAAMVERLKIKDLNITAFSEELKKESSHWPFPIKSCIITAKGSLSINLHRPSVFKHVLSTVSQLGDQYGKSEASIQDPAKAPPGVSVVNNSLLRAERERRATEENVEVSLNQLRGLLLTEHLSRLIREAGFQVNHLTPTTPAFSKVLTQFGLGSIYKHTADISSEESSRCETQQQLILAANSSKYRIHSESGRQDDKGSGQRSDDVGLGQRSVGNDVKGHGRRRDEQEVLDLSSEVQLDLQQFIAEEKLAHGKSGYDKNLQRVTVVSSNGTPSPVMMQCCTIEQGLSQLQPPPSHLIHVSSQDMGFRQQQVDLAWRLCTGHASLPGINQHHVTHGPVAVCGAGFKGTISASELLRLRESQTREASILKYGEEVQGEGWESLIHRLTIAGLKFEILGKQHRHMLKLDLSNSHNNSTWPDSRDGVFVMYNYARLCTLFSRFEQEVKKATYPPLPSISTIDFSLLREDQEWGLAFNYVLQYPVMLSECVSDLQNGKGPHLNIQTHRVCSFLASLCRDLSSYYSHTHILGEPRPHLIAVMFARLYLLRSVHQVLKNGFSLLNIEPLSQM
ncbi:DALR anticodon-binding domain-containing protein 3-like [Asterias rubens]|uniref:DALR anticodon-binding domain-containing protein 3-like n=1 Tax=Asterias rubens TaxID=7604 RepID=UPI0014557144|nr:DALR anticodon-binding domain-containing protein 3-like [Asterias rubens]